jgi:hypothetical protein
MPFTCSKIDLKLLFEIYLKTKIEKFIFFAYRAVPSPPFRPISAAGLAFLPRATLTPALLLLA